jgi:hypothetical protein
LLAGRYQTAVLAQWAAATAATPTSVSRTNPAYIAGTGSVTPAVPLTTTTTVEGLVYTANILIGSCYQPATGPCDKTNVAGSGLMYRIIVQVTWSEGGNTKCTGTLVNATEDPTFFTGAVPVGAAAPTVAAVGTQTTDKDVAISVPLTVTGTGPFVVYVVSTTQGADADTFPDTTNILVTPALGYTSGANIIVTYYVKDALGQVSPNYTFAVFVTPPLGPPTGLGFTRPCPTATAVAPVLRDVKSAGSSATSVVVPAPASQPNDVLIAFVQIDFNGNVPAPTGWAPVTSQVGGGGETFAFYRTSPTPTVPSSYTFSWSDAAHGGSAVVMAYTGVSTTAGLFPSAAGTSATAVAPTVTPGTTPSRHVAVYGIENGTASSTPPGMVQRALIHSTKPSDPDRLVVFDEALASAAATGTTSSALGASRNWAAFNIIMFASPGKDPTVNLSWTASPDVRVTGYEITRSDGAVISVAGRTTVSYADAATSLTTPYTYSITSVWGAVRSAPPLTTSTVPPC